MPVETATYISQLVPSNPPGSDPEKQGDDHIRLLKAAIQTSFPNSSKPFYIPASVLTRDSDYSPTAANDNAHIPFSNTAARTVTLPVAPVDGYTLFLSKTTDNVFPVTISGAFFDGDTSKLLRWQGDLAMVRYDEAEGKWAYCVSRKNDVFSETTALTTDTTLTIAHYLDFIEVSTSGGTRTITLPSTLPVGFRCFLMKSSSDVNPLVLSAAAGINGSATLTLVEQYMVVEVIWTGSAWRVPYIDTLVKRLGGQELRGGFTNRSFDAGTIASGTFTPNPFNGNKQHLVSNGMSAIAPPSSPCNIELEVLNGASAAAVSTSGFTAVDGAMATTVAFKYILDVRKTQNYSYLGIKALQ